MIGEDFIFNNKRLSSFGFMMAKPESADSTGLSREILKAESSAVKRTPVHYGAMYGDTIVLNFLIIRDGCDGGSDLISPLELRRLNVWLTYSNIPQPLMVEGEDGSLIEYNGIFTDITPYGEDELYGLNLTFTCDSPYAYKKCISHFSTKDCFDHGYPISLTVDVYSDSDDPHIGVYPIITFKRDDEDTVGFISILNQTDGNNSMKLVPKDTEFEEIVIDCNYNRIFIDGEIATFDDVNYSNINFNTDVVNMYWLRLLPGINRLTVFGTGDYTLEYKVPMKLGGIINV